MNEGATNVCAVRRAVDGCDHVGSNVDPARAVNVHDTADGWYHGVASEGKVSAHIVNDAAEDGCEL